MVAHRTDSPVRPRRAGPALAAGLAVVLLAGCATVTPSIQPAPPLTAFSTSHVEKAIEELARLGVETRVRPSDSEPLAPIEGDPSLVRLLRLQVRNLALERAGGAGTRGADLDALTVAAGGGPVSALIAGWATSAQTGAAGWAASLLGQEPPVDPTAVVFPALALIAFVADATDGTGAVTNGPGTGIGQVLAAVDAGSMTAQLAVVDGSTFCTEVSEYLSAALGEIVEVDADPPAWLRQVIDVYAPQYASDPELLRRTIGALALVTYVTSLARSWTVNLVPDPLAVAYGIEGQEPIQGDIVLTVSAGEDVFADDVADCASLADAQLASIPIEGSLVVWDSTGLDGHATEASSFTMLDDVASAGLTYETATESQEDAENGDPVTAKMWVNAWVDRAEMAPLAAIVKSILLGEAGGTSAGSTVKALYQAMEPTLNVVMRPSGFAVVDVTHHTSMASPSPTAAAGSGSDCETFLPAEEVQAAVGVPIGSPTHLGDVSVFGVACVWEDVQWSLQGQGPIDPPVARHATQFAGMPCERSGGSNSVIYCLNSADRGAVGGLIYTTRWGFILTTSELSIDEVVSALLPILDRTGN